jgi:hypothetical protein
VNRLAQFLQYTQKVFGLNKLLRHVRDGRSEPRIPILPVALCLVLGVVTRISSYLDLAQQTKSRRRWRRLCGLKAAISQGQKPDASFADEPRQRQVQLVQLLILIFGFTLFTAFALHSQWVRLGELTLKALARALDLGLEEDLPWELWFQSG